MNYAMSLSELLSVLPEVILENDEHVHSLSIDSRLIKAKSVFLAYPGEATDGRVYIQQAIKQGAVAIVYEAKGADKFLLDFDIPMIAVKELQKKVSLIAAQFYQHPSRQVQVFGITGTNGKTSCCYFLAQALTKLVSSCHMIGTIGFGPWNDLRKSTQTTPDPIQIQRYLAQCRDQGIHYVCMEVSSHALTQARVDGVQFHACLFTNLSHDHLDYHHTMQAYGEAKQRFFIDFPSQLVVTNAEDELGEKLIELSNSEFVVSYGDNADVSVSCVVASEKGLEIDISAGALSFCIQTPLIGVINKPNVLLIVATLLSFGFTAEQVQETMRDLQLAPGRMERIALRNGAVHAVVDYAHTPDALEKALHSVIGHCQGQVWCVFGCGGDRDKKKRAIMGEIANRLADHCVVTNDNPRSEEPELIARDITQTMKPEKTQVILLREDAIRFAIEHAKPNDWILIAGRGHEQVQQFAHKKRNFCDRDYVQSLQSRGGI